MLRRDLAALQVVATEAPGVAVQVVPNDLQLTLNLGPVERPTPRAVDVEPRVITHASGSHTICSVAVGYGTYRTVSYSMPMPRRRGAVLEEAILQAAVDELMASG